jgi:N-methylhydantoinase B
MLTGGTGGTSRCDGLHGRDVTDISNQRNNPLEVIESRASVRVHRYGLRIDSAGPGNHRGGCGIVIEFEVLAPDCMLVARGMERLRFQPWGLAGGGCGANGRIESRRFGCDGFEHVAKADALRVSIGDVVRLQSAGGGGYGDALQRDPRRVLEDVRNGFVSIAGAERDYAVVVANGTLDLPATEQLRRLRLREGPFPLYTLGREREEYERCWTADVARAMSEILYGLPQPMRYETRARLWRAMEKRRRDGLAVGVAELRALWEDLERSMKRSEFPSLPRPEAKAA